MNENSNKILTLFKSIHKKFRTHIIDSNLNLDFTFPQLLLLSELYQYPNITLNELSGLLNLSKSTVSGIVDRLVAQGAVIKETLEKDRRAVKLRVSDNTIKQIDIISKIKTEYFCEKLIKLSESQIKQIIESLELLDSIKGEE